MNLVHRLHRLHHFAYRTVVTAVASHNTVSAAAIAAKKHLGNRTMIIADNVNSSPECNAHLHLQFELQALGIQAAIFNMRQPIPTHEIFAEAKYMMQRLGATSICSIGPAYTTDLAKGLKYQLCNNVSDFVTHDLKPSTNTPIVAFPTSLSPHHTEQRICYVHKTENVILSHPAYAPNVYIPSPEHLD